MDPENDKAVQQKTHCLTPSKTDPLGFIHSDPTTLEMSSEAAKQTQMHVNTTSNHWGVKRVADYEVLRKHSESEDKAPWQEFTCQQVYLLDCRPDTQQTDSKFRDAPWRKKDTPKIANKTRRRPPTPPSPPRKRTAVFSVSACQFLCQRVSLSMTHFETYSLSRITKKHSANACDSQ